MSETEDEAFAAEWTRGPDGLWHRRGARVLLLSADGPGGVQILLVRGHDADAPHRSWWFTVGGGIAEGEPDAAAAARELVEETGIVVAPDDLVGPVFERSAVFDFFARTCRQDEVFFLARLPAGASGEVTTGGWTELELDVLDELRWWGLEELAAAQAAGTEVYPRDLAEHVRGLLDGWDGVLRRIA